MEPADNASLSEAMNRLWDRFLPQLEERVATLEAAAAALSAGTLTAELREQASHAAHNLAGVLGTFGLDEGTRLAREAEVIYSCAPEAGHPTESRLAAIGAHLRAMVATRKP